MLYTKTQKRNESTTTKLQGDEYTENGDSGISGEDSDSIGEPVNKSKINNVIMRLSKSTKAKTPKNKSNSVGESSKKLEVGEGCIVVNEFYYNINKVLRENLRQGLDDTSKKLKEFSEEYEELSNIVGGLESKTNEAIDATKSVTTAIDNHEKLLKSKCLGFKRKIIGTIVGIGGCGITCVGAIGAFEAFIVIGPFIVIIGICVGYNIHKKLYKELNKLCEEPNSTTKNINVEQGVRDNLHKATSLT